MPTNLTMTKGERQALINAVKTTWVADATQVVTINFPTRHTQDDQRRVKDAVAAHKAFYGVVPAVTYVIPSDPNG